MSIVSMRPDLRRLIALVLLAFLVVLGGCGSGKADSGSVITNRQAESSQPVRVPESEPGSEEAGVRETRGDARASAQSTLNPSEPASERSEEERTGQEGRHHEPVVSRQDRPPGSKLSQDGNGSGGSAAAGEGADQVTVIDGVAYRGYKGPVQGEVKYKEGTPASENAKTYKASGDIESPYKVDLIVTRDFGHQEMFAKTVGLVRDEVGMEVMFRNLDIQTAYGGGFVNAINGLESGYTFYTGKDRKKLDWFYWVNGILAPVGVAEYRPQPGDVIWWDYHDWSVTMFIPAVIGSYPQPFKNGFWGKNPGTVVMHTPTYQGEAERLKQSLESRGVKQVDTAPYDPEVLREPKKYYILMGLWDELAAGSEVLNDVNRRNKLVGVYVKFEDGEVKALDFKGNTVSSHRRAGAIYAYGSSIGSLYPVWVLTGTDEESLNRALDILIDRPGAIKHYFGAVVTPEGVIRVPYLN
ncbi:MAG: DUF4430 domain-containing protein [Clostridia bacterium]|jgi:hypothetical protein|nr:DUF4430 domain-containing protein [Clostridia bacterium]MDH7573505.1 DUF4430 domain-containing protein [Clostridia bacterium]